MNFADKLIKKILNKKSYTVVGLDPMFELIPQHIKEKNRLKHGDSIEYICETISEFNKGIIDSIFDLVPAVKPQSAYYEMFGVSGIKAFNETVEYAKSKGLIIIGDVKRNDIGSTAQAYSKGYLADFNVDGVKIENSSMDCITVNPYLGIDGIKPFIDDCRTYNKGIFVLVKTSNPSSVEIQDLKTDMGEYIYERISKLVHLWGEGLIGECGYSSVGAVVGATFPEQADIIRGMMPSTIFLVPGYGAQGGSAKTIMGCFNKDGLGAIINASRSVNYAYMSNKWKSIYTEESYADAARAEVIRMNNEIYEQLCFINKNSW